jgi:hypothetical protein
MSLNSINIKLPQLDGIRLSELHQGDVFMLVHEDNFYRPDTKVFMLLPIKPFESNRQCVCLLDGSTTYFKERQKVIRLSVTIHCNYWNNTDDGLPF